MLGEFVGIDKLAAVQQLREHAVRSGGFPGAVRTRYDIKSRHLFGSCFQFLHHGEHEDGADHADAQEHGPDHP